MSTSGISWGAYFIAGLMAVGAAAAGIYAVVETGNHDKPLQELDGVKAVTGDIADNSLFQYSGVDKMWVVAPGLPAAQAAQLVAMGDRFPHLVGIDQDLSTGADAAFKSLTVDKLVLKPLVAGGTNVEVTGDFAKTSANQALAVADTPTFAAVRLGPAAAGVVVRPPTGSIAGTLYLPLFAAGGGNNEAYLPRLTKLASDALQAATEAAVDRVSKLDQEVGTGSSPSFANVSLTGEPDANASAAADKSAHLQFAGTGVTLAARWRVETTNKALQLQVTKDAWATASTAMSVDPATSEVMFMPKLVRATGCSYAASTLADAVVETGVQIQRHNGVVHLHIPAESIVRKAAPAAAALVLDGGWHPTPSEAAAIGASPALKLNYKPTSEVRASCVVHSNGVDSAGVAILGTDGSVTFRPLGAATFAAGEAGQAFGHRGVTFVFAI